MLSIMQSSVMVTFYSGEKSGYFEDDCGINTGINTGINEADQKFLAASRANSEITTSEIAKTLGITARSAEYRLNRLKKLNLIERIGAKKNGKWLVH